MYWCRVGHCRCKARRLCFLSCAQKYSTFGWEGQYFIIENMSRRYCGQPTITLWYVTLLVYRSLYIDVAVTGSPSWASSTTGCIAWLDRCRPTATVHSASGLPSLCAGGECMRAAPASGAPRSRRTSQPLLRTPHPCASSLRPTSHWTLRAF